LSGRKRELRRGERGREQSVTIGKLYWFLALKVKKLEDR
jgi:hypothetical protein